MNKLVKFVGKYVRRNDIRAFALMSLVGLMLEAYALFYLNDKKVMYTYGICSLFFIFILVIEIYMTKKNIKHTESDKEMWKSDRNYSMMDIEKLYDEYLNARFDGTFVQFLEKKKK